MLSGVVLFCGVVLCCVVWFVVLWSGVELSSEEEREVGEEGGR